MRKCPTCNAVVHGTEEICSDCGQYLPATSRPQQISIFYSYSHVDELLRGELEARRESRRKQRRFRHDPDAYLKDLERRCLQLTLPA